MKPATARRTSVSREKKPTPITHIHLTVDAPTLTKVLKDLAAEKPAAAPAAPLKTASRFTPIKSTNDSSMARDTASGLVWSKTLNTSSKTHADCVKLVEELEAREKKGWRMPTVEELFLIADRSKCDPAIDTDAFPDTKSDRYWSASSVAGHPGGAWFVSFSLGYSYWSYRSSLGFVRAVRPSQ